MRKTTVLYMAMIMSLLLPGCAKSGYDITARADIEKYYTYMSSHPGFPISFNVTGGEFDYVEAVCDNGEVFLWNDRAGTPGGRGDRLSFDKKEKKIYWSPGEGAEKDALLTFLLYKDNRKVFEKKYRISYIGDGAYTFSGD